MNQKHFIILFALLIFFLIHVEKTHACYPSGSRDYECEKELGMLITILLFNNSTDEKLMHFIVLQRWC